MMEGEREQNEERKMRQWVSEAERKKIKVEERAVERKSVGGEKRENVCV